MPVPFIAKTKFTRKMTLVLRIVLIILGSVLLFYSAFAHMYIESVKATNTESLNQIASSYMSAVQYARSVANQIFTDSNKELFLETDSDVVDRFFYLNRLRQYLISTRFLDSIDILHNGESYHIAGGLTTDPVYDFVNQHKDTPQPVARSVSVVDGGAVEMLLDVYSLVYYETTSPAGSVENAVVLNFQEDWAKEFVASGAGTQSIFITDQAGKLLLSTLPIDTYQSAERAIEASLAPEAGFGKVKDFTGEGGSYYLSRSRINDLNVMVLTKEESFVQTFRTTILMTILVGVLLGLIVFASTFFYSRYFRRIISQIQQQLQASEDKYRSGSKQLKADFIIRLAQGDPESMKSIGEKCAEFSMNVTETEPIRLVLIEVDASPGNAGLSTYLRKKLDEAIRESLCERFRCEVILLDRENALVLMQDGEDALAETCIRDFQQTFYREQQKTVSAFIGRRGLCMEACPELFAELQSLKKRKLLAGRGCLLFAAEIKPEPEAPDISVYYTFEQNIIDALRREQFAKAGELFKKFLESDFVPGSIETVSEMIKKMLFSFFLELKPHDGKGGNVLFKQLDFIETLEDAEQLLADMIEKRTNTEKAEFDSGQRIVAETERFIDAHYSDSSLSVSLIAEHVGLSSGYLGQLYKKHRSRSINDCINAKRMERARYLLETTNEPVLKIAEMVGITNKTHLYKLFKKYYNATPTSFRK